MASDLYEEPEVSGREYIPVNTEPANMVPEKEIDDYVLRELVILPHS